NSQDLEILIDILKHEFDTVDLGDAKLLLGIGIETGLNAGTIKLSQEAFVNTISEPYGRADAYPAKKPCRSGARDNCRRADFVFKVRELLQVYNTCLYQPIQTS
ncbi:unnamed protein product, partial [Sphacelaria rigidula]